MQTTKDLTKNTNLLFGEVCIGCKNLINSPEYECSKGHKILSKDTPIKSNTPVTYYSGCYETMPGFF